MTETIERALGALTDEEIEEEVCRRLNCGSDFPRLREDILSDEPDDEEDDDDQDWTDMVDFPGRLDDALSRAGRRDYAEALYDLSVALGRDFDWINDAVEALRK